MGTDDSDDRFVTPNRRQLHTSGSTTTGSGSHSSLPLPPPRMGALITPQRHHSATPAISPEASSHDLILWQTMSPSGTLQNVIRARTSAASPESERQGNTIIQQLIEMRNAEQTQQQQDFGEGFSPTKPGRRPRMLGERSRTESMSGLEQQLVGGAASIDDGAIEITGNEQLTPLAKRQMRAIPRPLAVSHSARPFDKRELLSSLLLNKPIAIDDSDSANDNGEEGESTSTTSTRPAGTPSPRETDADNIPLSVAAADQPQTQEPTSVKEESESSQHSVSVKEEPRVKVELAAAADSMDLDDCLDMLDMDVDDLLDGLEDDIETDIKPAAPAKSSYPFAKYERCLVLQVSDGRYTSTELYADSSAHGARVQKVVRLYSQTAGSERTVLLRGRWYPTPVRVGDYMNIVGEIPASCDVEVIIGDSSRHLLPVLHPDILISSTHLSDAFSCIRRAVLRDRVREIRDDGPVTPVMLIGTLLHDLFQSCAQKNQWDDKTIEDTVWQLIASNLEQLWECGIDESSAFKQVIECKSIYQEWARNYMHGSAEKGAPFKLSSNGSRDGGGDDMVAISKVLAIEENVWSPKFGLNGKIDLTIQTKYRDGTTLVEPMELKTGRNSQNAAHRAQLVLYTLLLSDRYDVDVGSGILYYPRPNDLFRIPRLVEELQGLMAARNDMTTYIAHAHQTPRPLPAPIGNEFTCKFCSFAPTCFVVHRAMENGTLKSAKVPAAMWDPAVEHLAESHLAFVRKWMALIDGEESDMQRFRSELWKMSAEQREAQTGRCLANMALEPGSFEDSGVFGSYSRYKQALVPAGGEPRASMLDSQLSVGDPIIISSEKGHYAFALGYILSFEFNRVVVAINLPVRGIPQRLDGFDPQRNQDFAPIMEIRARHTARGLEDETVVHPPVPEGAAMAEMTFRLDKDEMSNGMSRIRANVMRMFVEKNGDRKARARIVDLEQPSFVALEESVEARVATAQQADSLNAGQVRVLRRVLAAEDYALVMGMPGTGKTTTIAALVDVLVSLGKSVLLASYTHVAVDNILLKLDERKVPFVRLGNTTKVDPRIHKYTPSNANLSSVHQLDEYFRKAPVVATTCLGVTHPLFAIRKFDYCIVDEASQITLPVCLGPLLAAHRFVLVGDHYQLPPLVRNTAARDLGLGTSLFKRLCEAHPLAVVHLGFQYRMNADIQKLANRLVYDGHLRCGSLQVASRKIQYPVDPAKALESWPFEQQKPNAQFAMPWVSDALDPMRGAVFVNTDPIPGLESRVEGSDLVQNNSEINIIRILVNTLHACGIEGRQIGVLSPYRAQLKQIEIEFGIRMADEDERQQLLRQSSGNAAESSSARIPGLDVHTIDRYQGRDADVIVISWVRSNHAQVIGELLRDWHRINVAITRAKRKLIMVGSKNTLLKSPLFAEMLRILIEADAVVDVPTEQIFTEAQCLLDARARGKAKKAAARTAGSALLKGHPILKDIIAEQG